MSSTHPKVLVIEDDKPICRGVVDALQASGYDTTAAHDGERGLQLAVTAELDLLLLDLGLPCRDGLDLVRELRTSRPSLPVIILTARGEEHDRIAGLKAGADDYVVKPFSVGELLARVEAVLRRSAARPTDRREVVLPHLHVDLDGRMLRGEDGSTETLSELEADLLRYFVIHPGRTLTREELLERVWRIPSRGISTRTVDVHVARLREKLKDVDAAIIRTVRGKGYVWEDAAPQRNQQ